MNHFTFDMQRPDEWSRSNAEKTISEHLQVSVSSAFHPYNTSFDDLVPDLLLLSLDQVFFYVHRHRILAASENSFAMLLASPSEFSTNRSLPTVVVPEPSEILNIIIHTIYRMSVLQYHPCFETVSATIDALPRYGLPPKGYVCAGQPLYDLVAACAPLRPIDTYALAAAHDLAEAAAVASAHLLSFPLSTLSDELALRMGAVYLKRLFFLHYGRTDALKRALLQPPSTHRECPGCSLIEQHRLTRAWTLAAAHITWDAGPNLSTHILQATLLPLQKDLSCSKCQLALRDRVARLVVEWALVKRTI
ncbi:hypothetical protein DAEQUDRAFT_768282 [Daedalea quercina L-15889]|uniref:BTB domain-containing protein n=1 Tax=Daedalea quercina L-15889 TaxID=1314783 RepID=A0A165MUF1_9APHY|nr:hypothetical protein DAEQUDRAFT_768282 [Daedalea quercina L-15889]